MAAGVLGGGIGLDAARARGLARGARRALDPELPQPRVLSSVDGELSLRLTGIPGVVDMNAPKPVRTYTFDGLVPGYTWEIGPATR